MCTLENHRLYRCNTYICCRRKSPVKLAELVPIQTSRPMELVCMDFLSLEQSKGGYEHILVITDHFNGFMEDIVELADDGVFVTVDYISI